MIQRCFFYFLLWVSVTAAFGTHCSPVTTSHGPLPNTAVRTRLFRSPKRALPSTVRATTSVVGGDGVPSIPKSEEETEFIRKALLENIMFTTLPDDTLDCLIGSFERTTATKDQVLVTQGDSCDGDYVYLVGDGECTVLVDGKVVPEPYGTLKPKAIFGELGVLYNQTRAATITAKSDTVSVYRVHADIFRSVLNHSQEDPQVLQQIDQAINEISGSKSRYGGDIIRPYKPNRRWLWGRWRGTVFEHNYRTVLGNMLMSLIFIVVTRLVTEPSWKFGLVPDKSHPFIQRLDIIRKIWSYQMSLTTFILTFYVQKAYSFWQQLYDIGRGIQGRLNDFHLLLATGAKRNPDGTFTDESKKLLDDVGAYSRLLHALMWSCYARRFRILGTTKGLERMATRGLITSRQLTVLQNLNLPDSQRHNACLEWMMIRSWQGIDDGTIRKDESLSQRLLDQMCRLRATFATIGDKLAGRMPLPYTHLVQILVDSFIAISPVALYPDLGAYSIFSVGVLTLFYTGLMDLAKVFLDPLDNEDFTKNSIDMDLGVLIRESNGGSTRWLNAGANLPFDVPQPESPPISKPAAPQNAVAAQ